MITPRSEPMRAVMSLVEQISPSEVNVLLMGESGVGRQTLARYIHEKSPRSAGPFVPVNLASTIDVHDTLFGWATTSSKTAPPRSRTGLVRSAHGGTLLLQNVEDMPLSVQTSLLRLLQEHQLSPVGAKRPVYVDVRVIATASPLLKEHVEHGRFRVDLYYRLNVIPIHIPPLRKRHDDIIPLARHFIELAPPSERKKLSLHAIEMLLEYPWPGNVQELKNVITRACLLSRKETIEGDDLSLDPIKPRPASEQIIQELKSRLADAEQQIQTLNVSTIFASPIWEGRRIKTESDLCFVLMPFADVLDVQRVYREYVKPTVEKCGLRCVRADDIYSVSGIMQDIWDAINKSRESSLRCLIAIQMSFTNSVLPTP